MESAEAEAKRDDEIDFSKLTDETIFDFHVFTLSS